MNYLSLVKILNYRFKVKKSRGHVCKSGLEPKVVNSATSNIHYMRSKVICSWKWRRSEKWLWTNYWRTCKTNDCRINICRINDWRTKNCRTNDWRTNNMCTNEISDSGYIGPTLQNYIQVVFESTEFSLATLLKLIKYQSSDLWLFNPIKAWKHLLLKKGLFFTKLVSSTGAYEGGTGDLIYEMILYYVGEKIKKASFFKIIFFNSASKPLKIFIALRANKNNFCEKNTSKRKKNWTSKGKFSSFFILLLKF